MPSVPTVPTVPSELRAGLRDGLRRESDTPDPAAVIFQHAFRHRRVYKALCGRKVAGGGGAIVHRHLGRLIADVVREHLEPQLAASGSDLPAEVIAEYYASATLGLLMWWVERDFRDGPARISSMHQHLTAPGIRNALNPTALDPTALNPATGAVSRSAPLSKSLTSLDRGSRQAAGTRR